MNFVDLGIVIGLLISGAYGWRTGLLRCLLGLAAIVASVWLALSRGGWVGDRIGAWAGLSPPVSAWVGAGLILVVASLGFTFIISLLDKMIRTSALGPINAIGGGLVGLLNGALVIGLLLPFLSFYPLHSRLPATLSASALARPVERVCGTLVAGIRRVSPNVEDLLRRMRADQGSVISRSPEVVEEVSRRAGQVWDEVDTLVGQGLQRADRDSTGIRGQGAGAGHPSQKP